MSENDVSPAEPAPESSAAAGALVVTEPAEEPAAAEEPATADGAADAAPAESDAAPAGTTLGPEAAPRRRGLPRGAAIAVVLLVVALALTAFAVIAPRANADQTFVDTARSEGHHVTFGDQQSLLVSAARKICERREYHATVAERRATALSPTELHAVQQTFVDDTRGFTVLALHTYCP